MIIIQPATGTPPFAPVTLDGVLSENRHKDYRVTEKPIENVGQVSDFVVKGIGRWTITGVFTATPLGQPYDPARPRRLFAALEAAADREQPVSVSSLAEDIQNVVIKALDRNQAAGDGEKETITIELQSVQFTVALTTAIDPSRLKARVRKGATKARGGAQGGKAGTGKRQESIANALAGGRNPLRSSTILNFGGLF